MPPSSLVSPFSYLLDTNCVLVYPVEVHNSIEKGEKWSNPRPKAGGFYHAISMKLLVAASWSQDRLEDAQKNFPEVEFTVAANQDDILREIVDVEAVFGAINREAFLAAKQLKWIQNTGAGVERLARISEIAESDVTVTNTRGSHAATIAEHGFGLLISLTRQLPSLLDAQREHNWTRPFSGPSGRIDRFDAGSGWHGQYRSCHC